MYSRRSNCMQKTDCTLHRLMNFKCIGETAYTQLKKKHIKYTGTSCICNELNTSASMKQPCSLSFCVNRLQLTIYFESKHDVSI